MVQDEIEVKKDTERQDEINAMKKAWEDAEPGRAAKALQSRLTYLNSHSLKVKVNTRHPSNDMSQFRSLRVCFIIVPPACLARGRGWHWGKEVQGLISVQGPVA